MNILLQPGFCSIFNVKGVSFEEIIKRETSNLSHPNLLGCPATMFCIQFQDNLDNFPGFAEHDVWFSEYVYGTKYDKVIYVSVVP